MRVLRTQHTPPTSRFVKKPLPLLIRTALVILGVLIMAVSPVIGAIPGPGGIFVFAAGLVLVLRNSPWALAHFARIKRRFPRFGHYADIALRRRSARRRRERKSRLEMR
jgi:hypothetical protein